MGKMAFADEAQTKRIIQQNLEYLWELVDTCDFDSRSHVDLVKRYAANHGIKVDLAEYPDQLMPILRRLAERERRWRSIPPVFVSPQKRRCLRCRS